MSTAITVDLGWATHVGAGTRKRNEDAAGARTFSERISLLAVADGLGGMNRGDQASRTAIETMLADMSDDEQQFLERPDAHVAWLLDRSWAANTKVCAVLDGAAGGTTLTAVAVVGSRMALTHVGDTRAYLLKDGHLGRLTKDHSVVAAMIEAGEITEAEALVSKKRNQILRCLGAVEEREDGYIETMREGPVGTATTTLELGTVMLIASDGVWAVVPSEVLQQLLSEPGTAQELADRVVECSLARQTSDNATACVLRVESSVAPPPSLPPLLIDPLINTSTSVDVDAGERDGLKIPVAQPPDSGGWAPDPSIGERTPVREPLPVATAETDANAVRQSRADSAPWSDDDFGPRVAKAEDRYSYESPAHEAPVPTPVGKTSWIARIKNMFSKG